MVRNGQYDGVEKRADCIKAIEIAQEAKDMAAEAHGDIRTHMAVCEKNQQNIREILARQDRALDKIFWGIVAALGAVALVFVEHLIIHR